MQLRRAINGKPDEKFIHCEKFTPFVIEQRAVRLDGVENCFATGELFLQCDGFAEEFHAEQRRLAALPREVDFRRRLALDVLPDVFREHGVVHAPLFFAGIQFFLFEIETVFAIEIANRADGFRQDMKPVSGISDGRLAHARKG